MSTEKSMIEEKVKGVLLELRPFLEADGGDIEFVEITEDGILKVKLLGACSDCSMSSMTLKSGVEEAVKKIVPEIHSVVAVDVHTVV
ncbi:MAG: NifU family protein [Crocinitomicaceae bacterium]